MLHLNMCSSDNVSKSYWFWCCDKQCILWGYKHEKFSDQLKNWELGNTRIPRSVEGHTSPLLARWHHSPFVGCHFGGDWNLRRTLMRPCQAKPRLWGAAPGKEMVTAVGDWQSTKPPANCLQQLSSFVLSIFCVENERSAAYFINVSHLWTWSRGGSFVVTVGADVTLHLTRVQTPKKKVLQMWTCGLWNSQRASGDQPGSTLLALERAHSVSSNKLGKWRGCCSGSLGEQVNYYMNCCVPFKKKQTTSIPPK